MPEDDPAVSSASAEDSKRQRAIDAIEAASAVHEAAWQKASKAIALMRIVGGDPSRLNSLRAEASGRVSFFNRLLAELLASATVVAAPTVEQIEETRALVAKVNAISVQDATTRASLAVLSDAVSKSAAVASEVETA